MIRRRFLEGLDLCAVPVMTLAMALASTQSGGQGRERNLRRTAGGEVMMQLTGLPDGDAQRTSTMPDARSDRNLVNPRQAPPPTVPDFRF